MRADLDLTYIYYQGFSEIGPGFKSLFQGFGFGISSLFVPSNSERSVDYLSESKDHFTESFKKFKEGAAQTLLFTPEFSAVIIKNEKESKAVRAVRIATHVIDTLLALAGVIPISLLIYASSTSMSPFFGAISIYSIVVLMLKKGEKGIEENATSVFDAFKEKASKCLYYIKKKVNGNEALEPEGALEEVSHSKQPSVYKPVISKDMSRFIQHIFAQYVVVTALMSTNSTMMHVVLRLVLGIKSYKGGMVDAHVIEGANKSIMTLSVFSSHEAIIAKVLGMGVLAPLSMGIADSLANLIVFRSTGNNNKEKKYAVLESVKGVLVHGTKLVIPFAMGLHYAGFIGGGMAYGINHLLDTITFKFPQNKAEIGEMFYGAALYAALGMIVYPLLPIHVVGLSNVDKLLLRVTAIGLVEAAAKYFVIPKLSQTKNMTIGEKIDLLAIVLFSSTIVGFTLNAALYTQDITGTLQFIIGKFGLPIMMPYALAFLTKPLLSSLEKNKIISEKASLVISIAIGVALLGNTFYLTLNSQVWKIVEGFLAQNPIFAEMMNNYASITGQALFFDATRAFSLGLSLVVFYGIRDKFFSDEKKEDEKETYITRDFAVRISFEMFKYFLRGALTQAFADYPTGLIFVHILTGLMTWTVRHILVGVASNDREKFIKELFTVKGATFLLLKAGVGIFDQTIYFGQDVAVNYLSTILPESFSSTAASDALFSAVNFGTSTLIEVEEAIGEAKLRKRIEESHIPAIIVTHK